MATQDILNKNKLQKAIKAIKAGKLTNAEKILIQLCNKEQSDISTLLLLSSVQKKLKKTKGLFECCKKILSIEPENTVAMHHIAAIYLYQQRINEALTTFQKIIDIDPDNTNALSRLVSICISNGYYQAAVKNCEQLYKIKPDDIEILGTLADCYVNTRQTDKARTTYLKYIKHSKSPADVYVALAENELYSNQHDHLERTEKYLKSALEIDPTHVNASIAEANVWYRQGKLEESQQRIKELIGQGYISELLINTYSTFCHHFNDCDYVIEQAEQIIRTSPNKSTDQRISLHFNLGRIYDKNKMFDLAFSHYEQGNALKGVDYNHTYNANDIRNIINTYNTDLLSNITISSPQSDYPIFIIGMPRSGTTLIEQILSSHKNIFGCGELKEIGRTAEVFITTEFNYKQGYPYYCDKLTTEQLNAAAQHYLDQLPDTPENTLHITDKMPQNFIYIGLIKQMFPKSKIIHCTRHPIDNILSIYFQNFSKGQDYAFKLTDIAQYYQEYRKIMTHWSNIYNKDILEIKYKNLIDNFEYTSRSLIDHINLEWDENCLNFHNSKRTVATASYDQVRSPIYTSSQERWKHYEKFISVLKPYFPEILG